MHFHRPHFESARTAEAPGPAAKKQAVPEKESTGGQGLDHAVPTLKQILAKPFKDTSNLTSKSLFYDVLDLTDLLCRSFTKHFLISY